MKTPHFAIVGAGTAGIAAAILLARQNIRVTLFEKVSTLEPVGAGLLLQPAGLAVFEHLGILDHAITLGAKVRGLEGRLPNQQLLVNSHYQQAHPDFYGLGIHRATLCHVLEHKAREYPELITWQMNTEIERYDEQHHEVRLYGNIAGQSFDQAFDAILIANGARSQLRPQSWVKFDQAYPWGAKWTIVPECCDLDTEILHQFHEGSKLMLGVLPTGAVPNEPYKRLSSVFWSMPTPHLDQFLRRNEDHPIWIDHIAQKWPDLAHWLKQHVVHPHHQGEWLSAHYRDVVMSKLGSGRVGVLGDAAHAMSPQLGQGANMALLDAWALSKSVESARNNENIDWPKLWQTYHQHRQSSTNFYQFLSRLLTPLYQSERWWTGPLRDFSFGWMYRIPYFRKEMALTVSGLKSGMFTNMQYQDIASNQSIVPKLSVSESVKIE
ncbi:FAD-dependent monooxygenase [Acinetobacter sp. 194]|uniref:FAD-dependent oxidoreductase n=1 Tax=Acinetobacter shaoyimingii TaxID=2715164 RepID=UPI00140A09A7|nr:NAD(P)/FAD-dependent oxidoreductase [Acinetobacter shaoyimingii]NHB56740.1 FAD-dependent monooxygenase [Acinetobacter shaoyimingii]